MKAMRKPVMMRFLAALGLCLTLFYAASITLYMNSASAPAPMVMADMPDCHMMDDMPPAKGEAPANKTCCTVVGCCPCLAPTAFVPRFQPIAMPLALDTVDVQPQHYVLASRVERPPRA